MQPRTSSKRFVSLLLSTIAAISALSGCSLLPAKHPATPADEALAAPSDANRETIVIFATGNLQGSLLPSAPNQGGAALIESYYKIAQKDFGNRVVWLDAGNARGPSLESGYDQGKSFDEFLSRSGMQVTLDGHPELYGTYSADESSSQAPQPMPHPSTDVSSPPYSELSHASPTHVVIPAGRLHLGVISANSAEEVTHQAQLARNEGANLVIWLSDMRLRCNPHLTHPAPFFRKPGEVDGFCDGVLRELITHLAPGTVNAVLTSGLDLPVNHFIYPIFTADAGAGVPVFEAAPFGKSVGLIYLTYDLMNRRLMGLKTRIEAPVPVCGKIFRNQGDCDQERPAPSAGRGSLVRSRFHGRTIEPDSRIVKLARPAADWVRNQEQNVLAQTAIALSANLEGESSFGDLVADAIRAQTHADFSLVQPGIFKHALGHSALREGPISWADLSRAMPADSRIDVIRVSGEELRTLVRISETGMRGFASVSGLKLRLIRPDRDAPITALTSARKRAGWEQDRILSMSDARTEADSDSIFRSHTYRLAVPDYLVRGGDDWAWASEHFGLAHRVVANDSGQPPSRSARELLAAYLKQVGKIDSVASRLQFSEPRTKGRRRGGHHRHHHHRPRHKSNG